MTDASPALPRRRSRLGLFVPFALLGLILAGWTTAWFMIRDRTSRALDDWIAREAALGRAWSCPNRTVGGFPFRIEVGCDSLSLQRPDLGLTVGPVMVVAQVYQPRHFIANVAGPLRTGEGAVAVDGNWRRLQASFRVAPEGLQRVSVVADGPALRLTGPTAALDFSAEHIETHLRPNPARTAEGAYDWSLQAAKLALPGLDALIGGTELADLDLDLTATQGRDVTARRVEDEVERWRQAGGRIEIARLALVKGARRLEGKGQFGLDEAHRPQGRADLAAVGLEGVLGAVTGGRGGATAALLGALTGRTSAPDVVPSGETRPATGLKPLPPLRIDGGRIQLGLLTIPGVRVAPLY